MKIENSHKLKEYHLKPERFGFIYYLLYNEEVMYVGKTVSVDSRIPAHKDKLYNKVLYKRVLTKNLQKAEMVEIGKYCPIYNCAGVPKSCIERDDCKVALEFDDFYIVRYYGNIPKNRVYRKDNNLLILWELNDYRDNIVIFYVDLDKKLISKEIKMKHKATELLYNPETHSLEPFVKTVYDYTQESSFKHAVYCDKGYDTRFDYINHFKKEQEELLEITKEVNETL